VYIVVSTYLSTCVARAACFVLGSVFLTAFCFLFSFSTNLIDTYVTVPFDVHIILRICQNKKQKIYIYVYIYMYIYIYLYFFFHHHPHFSNSYVCVSKHAYAFPFSSILIHIYWHILHPHFCNSCVCVSTHVYAFPSSSILLHIYCRIHKLPYS